MQVKLINPQYSYQGNGVVSFSVTFQLVDATTGVVYYENTASSQQNVNNPNWLTNMKVEIANRIHDAINTYNSIMSIVLSAFPNAKTPQDVLTQFAQDIENGINSGVL